MAAALALISRISLDGISCESGCLPMWSFLNGRRRECGGEGVKADVVGVVVAELVSLGALKPIWRDSRFRAWGIMSSSKGAM